MPCGCNNAGLTYSASGAGCVACANHSVPNSQRSGCDECTSLQYLFTKGPKAPTRCKGCGAGLMIRSVLL